ncbi:hypothetical protein CHCC20441_3837 [Bacillus licheniformis]|nr:hypothetical protein CHCC20441_3837 [Bacillus licheniformis]TWK64337.1 hypothetical protein CHCC20343_2992 [Bacillus licheniformis]TWK76609.1 hypothetical protein CHCC20339_0577 [Bacillus licheniformis]TWL41885.1 hypothetical protein CHCC15543_1125 [Bacillus licheniformis]
MLIRRLFFFFEFYQVSWFTVEMLAKLIKQFSWKALHIIIVHFSNGFLPMIYFGT